MWIRWIRIRNTDLNWSEQTEFWARITSRKVYNTLKINLLFPGIKYYWYVIYIYKFCIMFLEPVRWRIRLSLKIINNFVISRHRYMTGKSPVLHYKCHFKMLPKGFQNTALYRLKYYIYIKHKNRLHVKNWLIFRPICLVNGQGCAFVSFKFNNTALLLPIK